MSEANADDVDQSIIYVAYAHVMLSFQLFELSLWGARALKIKAKSTFEQAMTQVEKWDRNTLGGLLASIQSDAAWPTAISDEIAGLLDERNYLAHSFLRVYFLHEPSEEGRDHAANILADLDNRIDECAVRIGVHMAKLGATSLDELPAELQAELDALRPKNWGSED